MIRIVFPTTELTPAILIKNTALTTVSSGVMDETGPTNDGRFWYEYDYTGTPGHEYQIIVDGGATITDPELRYVNFWAQEEYTPADIEAAIITDGDGNAVLQAIADKIGNENVTAATIAAAVRTNLTPELGRIDVAISTRATPGDIPAMITAEEIWTYTTREITGGGSSGGGGSGTFIYAGGSAAADTTKLEKTLAAVETALKKDPDRYQKALETAQKKIIDAIKLMPAPIVNVPAPEVTVMIPEGLIEKLQTMAGKFSDNAAEKEKQVRDTYDFIIGEFKEKVVADVKTMVTEQKVSYDTIIESAIIRATSEFTNVLQSITLIES